MGVVYMAVISVSSKISSQSKNREVASPCTFCKCSPRLIHIPRFRVRLYLQMHMEEGAVKEWEVQSKLDIVGRLDVRDAFCCKFKYSALKISFMFMLCTNMYKCVPNIYPLLNLQVGERRTTSIITRSRKTSRLPIWTLWFFTHFIINTWNFLQDIQRS